MADILTPLYHYCSISTFHSIVTGKKLWLTSIWDFNDYMEVEWVYKQLWPEIKKNYSDLIPAEAIKLIESTIEAEAYKFHSPHLCCLSANSDLLSQWRGYADNGKGFAIGFNLNNFGIKGYIPFTIDDFENSIGVAPVVYDKQMGVILNACFPDKKPNDIIYYLITLLRCSLILKNPSFKEENEWRIIFMPHVKNDEIVNTRPPKLIGECYHIVKNKLATHYELEIPTQGNCLNYIVIGPKNTSTVDEIYRFLKSNGFDILKEQIFKSKISYR